MKYEVAEYEKKAFTCPYCNAFAEQKWNRYFIVRDSIEEPFRFKENLAGVYTKINVFEDPSAEYSLYREVSVSTCNVCHKESFWFDKEMVLPKVSNVPMPIEDMPENVKEIYNEARDVFPVSPKAAAALLRLALQHLCGELGESGDNINKDIGELVKKGLPVEIQQALDVVRVIGNNAVHPGTLDLDDNKENVAYLFNIINLIVDNQIVQKKKLEELYSSLPQKALEGIKNRDK